jgi:hypothetical protein
LGTGSGRNLPTAAQSLRRGEVVFAGSFQNADLQIDWKLIVADEVLTITTNAGWRILLEPAAPDRFAVGPWVLRFHRENGKVTGFDLHRERLWKLHFRKINDAT